MFLGIVQGIFLCFFFFSSEHRKSQVNIFHGFLLFSLTACILEIFLMYTGYIVNVLHLVDFSEVFGLTIGPAFYLMVSSVIRGKIPSKQLWHLAFPVFFLLMQIPFLIAGEDVKFNEWVGAYHPDVPFREVKNFSDDGRFWLTDHHTEFTLASIFVYGLLGLYETVKVFRLKKESFFKTDNRVLKTLRTGVFHIISALLLILIVKLVHPSDTGDHVFAGYISVLIYLTSFSVISESGFFKQPSLTDQQKYKGSVITDDVKVSLLDKFKTIMEEHKPFLQSDFSLPDLAKRLGTSVHTTSQLINEGLGKSFFEVVAEYRVREAKKLLVQQANIKVEEIAEQVGYNSKSSFNTAFKKITGKTPSDFRNSNS